MLFSTVRVLYWVTLIAPPAPSGIVELAALPSMNFKFLTATLIPCVATWSMRLELLPLMVNPLAAEPSIVIFFVISMYPLVSVIFLPAKVDEKAIVSPACARAIASLSEPAPLFALFVTVIIAIVLLRVTSAGRAPRVTH